MMRHSVLVAVGACALVATTGPGVAAPPPALPCSVVDPRVTCVMVGLDNPRGLAFDRRGVLFVAEAGYGGAPCTAGGFNCYGRTGAVSRLWRGRHVRIATGLPSISFPLGPGARGPHDIAIWSGKDSESSVLGGRGAHLTVGLEARPETRETLHRPGLGWLVHIPESTLLAPSTDLRPGDWSNAVDIAGYATGGAAETRAPDSDPYGLLVARGGHGDDDEDDDDHGEHRDGEGEDDDGHPEGDLVIDASANALLRIDAEGTISTVAVFPSRLSSPPRPSFAPSPAPPDQTTDAVPTTVVAGPDGAYYVGELTGVPFVDARANIYRVVPTDAPQLLTLEDACLTGFKSIIDMAFDHHRNLYVLQHSTGLTTQAGPGILLRIAPKKNGPDICARYQAGTRELVLGGLDGPTSIAIGPDGALYLSNHGASPAFVREGTVLKRQQLGEVLRIDLDHHDHHDDGDGDDDHHDHDHDDDHDLHHHESR